MGTCTRYSSWNPLTVESAACEERSPSVDVAAAAISGAAELSRPRLTLSEVSLDGP